MSSNDMNEGRGRFDVLGTMRALRDDPTLSATQLVVLLCAVLRTDNRTCKVRMSIEGIARDANVTEKTARSVFKSPAALCYLAKVEGKTRAKDMWFHPTPVTGTGVVSGPENKTQSIPETEEATPVTDASIPVTVTGLLPLLLPSPSTNNGASAPPEAKKDGETVLPVSLPAEDAAAPAVSLFEKEAAPRLSERQAKREAELLERERRVAEAFQYDTNGTW